jgi:broad specificity phosphatase PhoE
MKVTITYFVHGTTIDNEQDRSTGWLPGELSELGVEQSVKLKEQIRGKKFDVVFCSDLKRAVDSANLTFSKSIKIIQDKRLRECNYGDLNGAPSEKVQAVMSKCIEAQFPNGESYKAVEKRMRDFLNYLAKRFDGKHIAIVAHQAPQLALDVIVKGRTWQQAMKEDWRLNKTWQPGWDYVYET